MKRLKDRGESAVVSAIADRMDNLKPAYPMVTLNNWRRIVLEESLFGSPPHCTGLLMGVTSMNYWSDPDWMEDFDSLSSIVYDIIDASESSERSIPASSSPRPIAPEDSYLSENSGLSDSSDGPDSSDNPAVAHAPENPESSNNSDGSNMPSSPVHSHHLGELIGSEAAGDLGRLESMNFNDNADSHVSGVIDTPEHAHGSVPADTFDSSDSSDSSNRPASSDSSDSSGTSSPPGYSKKHPYYPSDDSSNSDTSSD